jgi:hypothetical protein
VLSTIVGAELADRDFEPDEDTSVREVMNEIEPVEVTLEEIVRGCPVSGSEVSGATRRVRQRARDEDRNK